MLSGRRSQDRLSRPQLAIERTILNRFGDVLARDVLRAGQIRDGARDFQDAVVSSRAQIQITHGELQQILGLLAEFAKLF